MSHHKPGIPSVAPSKDPNHRVLSALKENVEILTGVRGHRLEELDDSATNDEIIEKINEIIERLNAHRRR